MSNVFGKTNSRSDSVNTNKALINQTYSPTMNTGVAAGNQIASMLGLNGNGAQNQAFQNWQNSTGYKFGLQQGLDSINGNAAAQGLMNSGATAKALETYGQNYANTQYGNYLSELMGLGNQGLQAGNLVANVGQNSSSQGAAANGGAGGLIGGIAGGLLGK
jgi:hypothetical protein